MSSECSDSNCLICESTQYETYLQLYVLVTVILHTLPGFIQSRSVRIIRDLSYNRQLYTVRIYYKGVLRTTILSTYKSLTQEETSTEIKFLLY
jgi:hypothetical protein